MNVNSTRLHPNCETKRYRYLPNSWNLLECFEHYLKQEELWSTDSIEVNSDNDSTQDTSTVEEYDHLNIDDELVPRLPEEETKEINNEHHVEREK